MDFKWWVLFPFKVWTEIKKKSRPLNSDFVPYYNSNSYNCEWNILYIYVANIKIFKKQLSCFFSCHQNKRQSDASDCFPLLLILYKSILKLYFVLKMIRRARLWLLLKVQKWFWKINFSVWYIFFRNYIWQKWF